MAWRTKHKKKCKKAKEAYEIQHSMCCYSECDDYYCDKSYGCVDKYYVDLVKHKPSLLQQIYGDMITHQLQSETLTLAAISKAMAARNPSVPGETVTLKMYGGPDGTV